MCNQEEFVDILRLLQCDQIANRHTHALKPIAPLDTEPGRRRLAIFPNADRVLLHFLRNLSSPVNASNDTGSASQSLYRLNRALHHDHRDAVSALVPGRRLLTLFEQRANKLIAAFGLARRVRGRDDDDELVEDLDTALEFVPQAPVATTSEVILSAIPPSTDIAQTRFTLDQYSPLFFPIPEHERVGFKARVKDPFSVSKEKGWDWRNFCRTQTTEEIKQKWEEQKAELTKDWKRRYREAIKSKRRRGGVADGE